MVSMTCVSPGGSGGNGFAGAAAHAGGGGAGGSGSFNTLTVSGLFVPEILYISVGAGNSQLNSYIAIGPFDAVPQNVFLYALPGNPGTAGTSLAGGTAGTGGGQTVIGNCFLAGSGVYAFQQGIPGENGGYNSTGPSAPTSNGLQLTGGGGGGGLPAANTVGFAGATINAIGGPLTKPCIPVIGGAGGTTAPTSGAPGGNGININNPGLFAASGGAGGGSSGLSVSSGANGGDGGRAGYGCGGGGGGAAFTGFTPGNGGAGGSGVVIMVSW